MQLIYSGKKQVSDCLRMGKKGKEGRERRITKEQERTAGGYKYVHYH